MTENKSALYLVDEIERCINACVLRGRMDGTSLVLVGHRIIELRNRIVALEARAVADGRFARTTAHVSVDHELDDMAGDHNPHNDALCPECTHRVGGHGKLGCMHMVDAGLPTESVCRCRKAMRDDGWGSV